MESSWAGSLDSEGESLCLQYLNKSFLRDIDTANALHPLLPLLLFFKEFALSCNIAAVTFCRHVFAQCRNAFARDDFATDRRLDCNLVKLARNYFFWLRCQLSSPSLCPVFVHDGRESIDWFAVHQQIELH